MFKYKKFLLPSLLLAVLLLLLTDINPVLIVFFSWFSYIVFYVLDKNNKRKKHKQNQTIYFSKERIVKNKMSIIIDLVPVISNAEKKIVFYHCILNKEKKIMDNDQTLFLDVIKFILSSKEIQDRRMKFMIDLPFLFLVEDTFFYVMMNEIQNNPSSIDQIIFNIDQDLAKQFSHRLIELGNLGIHFNINGITSSSIDFFLTGSLEPYVYSCQIEQEKLITLLRDDYMNTTMHKLNDYRVQLLLSGMEKEEDLKFLPSIVDLVDARCFRKIISVPFLLRESEY